jgi:hypothetical protein
VKVAVSVRRFALGGCLLAPAACAHIEAPPGGAEDLAPPALLATRPDSLAVLRAWNAPAVLVFDERVSERGVEEAVSVSPRTSPVRVQHRGDEIRVSLRDGWQPGVIYHVTLEPTVQDLFGNRIAEPVGLVFSTGPQIPDTRVSGAVVDRITGRPEVGARVEAIRAADSLVYAVPSDSAGRFVLARIPEGDYRVRAYRDLNRNRALDPFEQRDTTVLRVAAGAPEEARLALLMPDTTPPVLASVTSRDGALELRTDDHLDPEQELGPAQVEIVGPDGRALQVARVTLGAEGAAAGRAAPTGTPADPPAPPDLAATGPPPAAPERLPSQLLIVELAEGVAPTPGAEYLVRLRAVRNVNGLVGDSERTWTAPAAEPAAPPAFPAPPG